MTGLRSTAALLGAASLLVCGCGKPAGDAASAQAAASAAQPAASPAEAASSDAAASALAPVAAAPPPAVAPASAPAPPKRQPTAAELLRDDPVYAEKERRLDALYGNARERDPTGQVEREQANALAERRACVDKACLDAWFRRREAALRQYVEN